MQFFYTLLLLVASFIQAKAVTRVGTFVETACNTLTTAECGVFLTLLAYQSTTTPSGDILYLQCFSYGAGCVGDALCDPLTAGSTAD